MPDYLSKTEFYLGIKNQISKIDELTWSDIIPLSQTSILPENEGVIILFDNDKRIICTAIAATNNLRRRLLELLKDSRYSDTSYFQYTLESDRPERFSKRTGFKHIFQIVQTPIENFENVLEDDDPRIVEKEKKLQTVIDSMKK